MDAKSPQVSKRGSAVPLARYLSARLMPVEPNTLPPNQPTRRLQPDSQIPQLVDITRSTKIQFDHLSSPAKKYIVESMSGGVAIIDYDRDGWPDIYFTNAPGIDMALAGRKARSALFHNNHDGTFTDVTDKAGVGLSLLGHGRFHRGL